MHCSPAPPCTSPSMLTPVAIALFRPMPQVAAIRATAIEGACGPWSTEDTSAASSSRSWPGVGASPRSISQMMPAKLVEPISSWTGRPRSSMTSGSIAGDRRRPPVRHVLHGRRVRLARSRRRTSSARHGTSAPAVRTRRCARPAAAAAPRAQRSAVDEHAVAADPQRPGRVAGERQVGEEAADPQLLQLDGLRNGQDARGRARPRRRAAAPIRVAGRRRSAALISWFSAARFALRASRSAKRSSVTRSSPLDQPAQHLELLLPVGGDVERPVRGVEGARRRGGGVLVAHRLRWRRR